MNIPDNICLAFPERLDMNVRVPGSKSATNRALIAAALGDNLSVIRNASPSDDTARMIEILRAVGIAIEQRESELAVAGCAGAIPSNGGRFDVGSAGTVMRFLIPFFALGRGTFVLDGDARMRERPIGELVEAVNRLGGDARCLNADGCPPVEIRARGLEGGSVSLDASRSSQFVSALLLAAPLMRKGLDLTPIGEWPSKPYVTTTIETMQTFGKSLEYAGTRFVHPSSGAYRPATLTIPGDADGANYFLAMAAVRGGTARVTGIPNATTSWEGGFSRILADMGCRIDGGPDTVTLTNDGVLHGGDFDMNDWPDSVQTLACAALFAEGSTAITNIANLRYKETDRIAALRRELTKIGATVVEIPDGLRVIPAPAYRPASIATSNDHRMVMAFAVAAARIDGLVIEHPACVAKSFPEFFTLLQSNGIRVESA